VWSFRDVTERMKVIAELRLSEERFRQMAENIHEVFYIAESDHSRIYYVSPVFEEIWGIPCGVLYENPAVWTERIHPEDSERFRSVIAEAARTGQYSLEYRVVRPDGATRWVWGRGYGIKDGGDSVRRVVGIIEDITRRKLDEEAIVNSEKRYRLLFDANPQPMFVVDEETLAFLAVNEAAVRHYGYSREEFLRMTIKDIRPPEDIPKVIEAAGLAVMPVLRPTQWRHRKKDGTILRVEITFDTLIFGGRRARVAHAHDITDRLKADERLRESESRLKIAQRIARLGSWEWNLPSGEVHWSDELFRIYGYEPAAFTPTTESFWKLVHPEDQGLLVSNLQAAVQTHQELIGEFRVIRPDGTIAHIRSSAEVISDGSGKPVRVRGTAQDITDWKRTEAALRESEERYALAVHGANDGVWDWNLKDNRAYFSPRFKSMLGYGPEDLSYDPFQWINLVHGEDRQRVELAFDSHIRGLTPHLEVEYKMKHKNGEYRWVLCRGAAIRDSQGKAIRMAGSQTDITDRKQVHEQLLHDAFHDSLTGLPNRALFMDRLDRALARLARGSEYRFATLFLDLDRFKNINDSLGHMTGDRLLIETARRLSQCVRPGDSVARLGGDEFSILLDDIGDPEEATEIAGRIIREISRVYQVGGQEVFTAASIGIALSAPRYTRPEEILRDADTAMYRAKTLGRGRYEIFDISM
ncbi:PAS domain-containing protein, partial [Candidatus Sumerlaeota bacterium]|nr:PAS domain-containing protein [Candidatus Sumerlaeota bacterium]